MRAAGAGFLLVAALAMLVLTAARLAAIDLPGCGGDSPCARATASAWGRLPWLGWPVSSLGSAYFLALLAAWWSSAGRIGPALRWITRLGVLVSLTYTVVIIIERLACPYCLAAHAANLGFAVLVERLPAVAGAAALRGLPAFACVAVAVGGCLGLAERLQRGRAAEKAERLLGESTEQIVRAAANESTQPSAQADGPGFTGRYRLGPARAPIRIVVISGYQCPDCRSIEMQARTLLEARQDVSLSIKQFPLCRDCNSHAEETLHANACWAARAAEAAGILGGESGFWRMHRWLFNRGGSFRDGELRAALPGLGFDASGFVAVMEGEQTLQCVRQDIEEAVGLGLHYTPMIFINGVELRGWNAPDALRRAVERVAATNPPPAGPQRDQPPAAVTKAVGDWLAQPALELPPDQTTWALGPDDAAVQVVMFGDYQEANSADLDARLRDEVERRGSVRYVYRHYPLCKDCNPALPQTFRPLSCLAARAAEAAGALAGNDAYWKMHVWLMGNQDGLSEESVRQAAAAIGLDPAAFAANVPSSVADAAILEDAEAGRQLGLTSIPALYLQGRSVPRWSLGGGSILPQLLDAAQRETQPDAP